MHDVIVTYSTIPDPDAFLAHYQSTHIPLVNELPELEEFAWGFVSNPAEGTPRFIARLTYASRDAANRSLSSDAGKATAKDVPNFAPEGVAILQVTRGA